MARSSRRSLFLVVFFLLACGFLGILFAQRSGQQSSITGDSDVKDSLKQFADVYALVEENYAEPVNADKAIYNGKYYGVGMTVGPRNNKVIVIYPFTGTPAYKAGIHPGDVIIAVDGKSTENMSTGDVADMLKGPKGTTVHISIAREGVEKPMEFTLVRDEIPRYSVDVHFVIKPGVGYMHVNGFNETTEREVAEALDSFGDLKGLILDLRGNPGGLLSEGVGVADKFLKKGQLIVSHHGRASAEKRYIAQHGNGGKEYPVVVLVNRLTASAAEIVSGAIQDHDRGLIVGEVTFGKGLVQTVYPLSENTGLALTTAHYYTPSGRLIQRDYSNISLYDYYYNRSEAENNSANREVKLTDSGRTVYGGGGITPDVNIPPIKSNHFQDTLLQHYAFFNFAKRYVVDHHPTKSFEVDDTTMQAFRKSLDEANIAYTQADLIDNADWLKSSIKSEIFIDAFGQDEGMKVRAESDPEVVKGLELLPQAKALADNAKKIVAEHNAAPAFNR
jgi:carboxyl-terminal processing protease